MASSRQIAVIGAVRVRLPLALLLARAGRHVLAVDTHQRKVHGINDATCSFDEADLQSLLSRTIAQFPNNRSHPDDFLARAVDDHDLHWFRHDPLRVFDTGHFRVVDARGFRSEDRKSPRPMWT